MAPVSPIIAHAAQHPGERLDDLQRQGLRILQHPEDFRFGTDAVLLAHFAGIRPRDRVIDLGTGSGILPLLLSARAQDTVFDAVELLPHVAERAARSVALNGLSERIRVYEMDLRDAPGVLGHGHYDLLVCNPPYARREASLQNPHPGRAAARHEGETVLVDVARASAALLRNGGRGAFVFPAQRMLELTEALSLEKLEPKRVQLVHPCYGSTPHLVLVEAVRNAGRQLHWLPPLFLADGAGEPTPALREIYGEECL